MIKNNLTSHFLSIKNIIRKYFQINDNNNYMKRNFKLIKLNPADWKYYKKIHLEALKTEPQAFETSFSDAVKKSNNLKLPQVNNRGWLQILHKIKQNKNFPGQLNFYLQISASSPTRLTGLGAC